MTKDGIDSRVASYQEAPSSQHQTQETEYLLKSILDENKTHYLVDWEDDPVTGEIFDPTWEPHEFANKNAIRDWEAQKAKGKSKYLVLLDNCYDCGLTRHRSRPTQECSSGLFQPAEYSNTKTARDAEAKKGKTFSSHPQLA